MSNNDSVIISDKLMYGIWMKGTGWLKSKDGVFADYSLDKVKEVRDRIGSNAKVYFIDNSLIDLELFLLEMERKNNLFMWLQRLTMKAGKNGISSTTS